MNIFLVFKLLVSGYAIEGTGLKMSIVGDMIYSQGINKTSTADEKMTMRGAEIALYAPVDHNFNGTLNLAAHDEGGNTYFEIHEMFLDSGKIIPNTEFKVGRFFLGVGRINRIHRHDWPFIKAPRVFQSFFGLEGVFDDGLEMSHLLPMEKFYLNFTWGITSGYRYGHAHTRGSKPRTPLHYLKLETFQNFSNTEGMLIGINYLGRTDQNENQVRLVGLDLTAKWRDNKKLSYMFQSELWYRHQKNNLGVENEQAGVYFFNQYSLTHSFLAGLRLDMYKDLSKRHSLTDRKINNIEYGIVPEITWKSSEFANIKMGFSHTFTREEGRTERKDTRFEVQWVFILGAHPAHNF